MRRSPGAAARINAGDLMTRKRYIKLLRAVYTYPYREKHIQMFIGFARQRNQPYWEMLAPELLRDTYIRCGVPLPRELRRI